MRLYDLSVEMRGALDELDAADGELDAALEARLDAVEGDMARKIDAVLAYAAERKAEAVACGAEAKRLAERGRVADAHAERLRDYVLRCMEAAGVRNVDGVRFRAALATTPARVVVTDVSAVPDGLMRVMREPDKAAIKAALAAGEVVPGAHMETGVTLRVR